MIMDVSSYVEFRKCPRCGYDLRASQTPRCSECGLAFSDEMWASGVLRDNQPLWLDRVDPWQPLAVLGAAAYDVGRALLRPGWVLHKLDPAGPRHAGWLVVVGGLLWLWLLLIALLTLATLLHTPVSPAAALRAAALWWTPPLLLVGVVAGACVATIGLLPSSSRLTHLGPRGVVRLGGLWTLVSATAVTVPVAVGVLALPDMLLGHVALFALLAGVPASAALPLHTHPALRANLRQRTAAVWATVGWLLGSTWLAQTLLPATLTPPFWTYF
jgi:hypothetical protein